VSRRERNILLIGFLLIVLLAVGYYFLFLRPLLNNLDERAQERDDKQAQLANLQQQVAELEAVRENSAEIERQLLELSKRIPTQPEIPTLVVQVEEIADAAGVTQLSIEPGDVEPPPGGGDFSVLPVTMSFTGTYEQMQDFLLRTRNLARLVTVRSVTYCRTDSLGAGEAGAECPGVETGTGETTTVDEIESELQVEIEAEVYFQPAGVPAGPAPTAPETTTPPEETTTPPEETTEAEIGAG
jgi:type IV pilus assembly protein PilO